MQVQSVSQPPWILCLETATEVSSAALFRGKDLMGLIEFRQEKAHARLVTRMIGQLLENLGLTPRDLTAVAVSKGPGSYTGLRVGVSAAKGLCLALDIPLLSVGSLEALASQAYPLARQLGAKVVPMIDARRMEAYVAVFSPENKEWAPVSAHILTETSFGDSLMEGKMLFVGNSVAKAKTVIQHSNALFLDEIVSSAVGMGALAFEKWEAGDMENIITFEPFYLKDFVATPSKKRL